jgi:hypothetical protein
MKFFQKIKIMILFSFLLSACIAQSTISTVSNQGIQTKQRLQGIWEVEGDTEAYMIFEGRVNYSIINLDGNIIVRKRLFGFLESIPKDSIDIRNLQDDGVHFIIFTGKYKPGKFVYNQHSDFNDYSYDLDEDYFIYYGNDPVTLNKIDSLPKNIQEVFEKKKAELAHIKFVEK